MTRWRSILKPCGLACGTWRRRCADCFSWCKRSRKPNPAPVAVSPNFAKLVSSGTDQANPGFGDFLIIRPEDDSEVALVSDLATIWRRRCTR
jgi:hypothetical protein